MNSSPPLLYLSAADVHRALPMSAAITAMNEAFVQLSNGQAAVPTRSHFSLPGQDALMLLMPCQSAAQQAVGVKTLTFVPANSGTDLPLIHALMLLFDAISGIPLAIMDGASLTSVRTGAASGAATDALARADASTAAVFGAGRQARTQLEAVCAVRKLRRARVFDHRTEAAHQFATEMSQALGLTVEVARSSGHALEDAQIVCTATTAGEPVFQDSQVAPGTHINAIGVFKPQFAEIPPETVRRAVVVVDSTTAALEEAGDLLRPLAGGRIERDHFGTELGQVLANTKPGRRTPEQVTLFKSVGVAIQDLCAAASALRNARRLGIGTELGR